mmetsp:Transcript_34120/g.102048  ORF Transcript_34120/g.102048 Transcript_34120/m.102048 type:complete len:813 (-) Transcript_34120:2163-4601(-)
MGNTQGASYQQTPNAGIGDDVSRENLSFCTSSPVVLARYLTSSDLTLCAPREKESGWLFQVLEFSDTTSRVECVFLSKRHCKMLTSQESFKWRLVRLHHEHGIYFPPTLPAGETWRSLFQSLFKQRHLWGTATEDDDGSATVHAQYDEKDEEVRPLWQTRPASNTEENFNITVCARFKPLNDAGCAIKDSAVLPLHQRLALIRVSNNLATNREALSILKEQGGWFKDKWNSLDTDQSLPGSTDTNSAETKQDRQFQDEEESNTPASLHCGIHEINPGAKRVVIVDRTKGLREFDFDYVFDGNCGQQPVYECSAARLVCDFINGFNATCLVYGMTGSGKTHTMFGSADEELEGSPSTDLEGIVPRACKEVFEAIEYRKRHLQLHFDVSLSASFVEIYGNDITDLLKKGNACGHSKAAAQRYVLEGTADVPVRNKMDVMTLLQHGESQKRKAATAMNERSSRAHSLFILTLRQQCLSTDEIKTSKLFLADLGGCEQTKKSDISAGESNHVEVLKQRMHSPEEDGLSVVEIGESGEAVSEYSTGFVKSDRMREAVYINLGLMSLKGCVEALNSGNPNAHVPYANSKLTMMLSSGLGGNSKTAVVVCAAQEQDHLSETTAAMKFGQSCRQVSNTVTHSDSLVEGLIHQLDKEIAECEEIIREKERWEVREEKRVDSLAEQGTIEDRGFGGIEVRKTTVLVGAETERRHLDSLLLRRSQLTGRAVDKSIDGIKFGGSVGFGVAHVYGLGDKFTATKDKENYRFQDEADHDMVPLAVKSRAEAGRWKTGDDIKENSEDLERRAKTAQRNTLVYSGISA